jgi:cardiolipin synthase A/B
MRTEHDDLRNRRLLQELADRALARTAGAPLVAKNQVRLLKDAGQNYPAWLEAIKTAKSRSLRKLHHL